MFQREVWGKVKTDIDEGSPRKDVPDEGLDHIKEKEVT